MGLFQRIGTAMAKIGFGLGADPAFIPDIGQMFNSFQKNIGLYYDAASSTRLYNDWSTTTDTFYNNTKNDLKRMISRSRLSLANQGLSNAIDRVYISNVIGQGIRPEPVIRINGELAKELNQKLAEGWKRHNDQWSRDGRGTYYEAQKLGFKTIINSGSVLCNTVKSKKGDYLPVAFQMIEPDRLDWSKDWNISTMESVPKSGERQFGIDLDKYGAVRQFWVGGMDRPVSADKMDIRFARERLQQYIGVPWKAPVLKYLWNTDNAMEDKSIASRIQAMIAMWVKPEDGATLWKGKDSSNRIKWEPARIISTKTKPEVIQSDDKISENFNPFMRLLQRMIAMGTGLSYQITTKDLEGMNFAASRANVIEDRRIFRMTQAWFIKEFCQVDWSRFVYWMFLSGKMAPYTFNDYLADPWMFQECHWMPPGFDWVDPYKDARAEIELRKNNMLTLKEHYANKGKNWEAELEQIAVEKSRIKALEEKFEISMNEGMQGGMQSGQQQVEQMIEEKLDEMVNDGSNQE